MPETPSDRLDGPVHLHFGLSYANYLVIPRTLMQSMPLAWQERIVACLDELYEAFGHIERADAYKVTAAEEDYHAEGGRRLVALLGGDPVPHYDHGRTYIAPKETEGA